MARQWKPGDVALVVNTAGANKTAHFTGRFGEEGVDHWSFADGSILLPSQVTSARPLVVIDPEDREQVERLVALIDEACEKHYGDEPTTEAARTEAFVPMQAALRSLVADPRPDEPQGLGAVVEDSDGTRWVRVSPDAWQREEIATNAAYLVCHWVDVAAVQVLSEGWSE